MGSERYFNFMASCTCCRLRGISGGDTSEGFQVGFYGYLRGASDISQHVKGI